MQFAIKLLCCIAAVSAADGFRARSHSKSNSTVVVRKSADCASLGDITVVGRNIGQAATLLCQFWPAKLGQFPVDNAKTIADLVNKGGDIWAKVKELAKGRPGGSPFCWKKAVTRQVLSTMLLDSHMNMSSSDLGAFSNCDMQKFGKCYDSCPSGLKPMSLIGGIVPLCTSECKETTHTRSCGLGCATGLRSCLSTLVDQVGTVAKAVGSVASYMTGNPLIHEVVDKVLRIVDFFIDTVFQVVLVAKKVYSEWPREEAELGVIIALLQFVLEHAQEIGKSFQYLNSQWGETLEMIMELMDAEFTWKEINLDFIASTILTHGRAILDASFEFAEVFVFPTCVAA